MATLRSSPSFLGTGLAFPLNVSGTTGATEKNEGIEHLSDSIVQIMGTSIGTRFFRRGFGSGLRDLIFEPIDDPSFESDLIAATAGALRRWEKRISIEDIRVIFDSVNSSKVEISISYVVADSQVPGNLVIPFILTDEGTLQLS